MKKEEERGKKKIETARNIYMLLASLLVPVFSGLAPVVCSNSCAHCSLAFHMK
jgi:hypothetical protein